MALTTTPAGELGSAAPDFELLGVDGRKHPLVEYTHGLGVLVAFICNHCPYVQAILGRFDALAAKYGSKGIPVVGINPNDSTRYPDDSFEAMQSLHREKRLNFSYLIDPTQSVARAYGAVCTPDFFLYRQKKSSRGVSGLELVYRGRLDDSWKDESAVKSRELDAAMEALCLGLEIPAKQPPSMGCSIKWLPAT